MVDNISCMIPSGWYASPFSPSYCEIMCFHVQIEWY